jgi:uncharacterized SAM-binding protein YcdF (DUF218 family)
LLFHISKWIEDLLLPSNAIVVIAIAGLLLLLFKRTRAGLWLLALASISLLIVGWLHVGNAALRLLEDRFPRPALSGLIDGIVVLGGEIDTHVSADRKVIALTDAGERLTITAELSRRFPNARIVLSGGIAHSRGGGLETESSLARDLLVAIGVAADRITIEEKSRNTCENARYSKAAAKPGTGEKWLLITSANHMPRAVACFRAAGFHVVPYPVDYRTLETDSWRPNKSVADGLTLADLAAHEWIGLAGYSLIKGTEFFPSTSVDN